MSATSFTGDKTTQKGAGVYDVLGNARPLLGVQKQSGAFLQNSTSEYATHQESLPGDVDVMAAAWSAFSAQQLAPPAGKKTSSPSTTSAEVQHGDGDNQNQNLNAYASLPDYIQRPVEALIAGGTLPQEVRRAFSKHVVGLVRRLTASDAEAFVNDLAAYTVSKNVTNLEAFAVEKLKPYLPAEATCLFSHTLLDPAFQSMSTDFSAKTDFITDIPRPLLDSRAHTSGDPSTHLGARTLGSGTAQSDDVLALAHAKHAATRGATVAEDARSLTTITATGAVPTARYPLRNPHPTARDLLVARASGLSATNLPPGKLVEVPLNVAARQSNRSLEETIWREQEERRAALEERRAVVESGGTPTERRLFAVLDSIEQRLAERRALSQAKDREGLRQWQRDNSHVLSELRKEQAELQRALGLLPDVPHGTI